jgi:predicted flap endonuclease-1-like 5' DNA nuclease
MQYLLLQTFAWMCFAGLIGAILGCMARRFFGARTEEGELAPAGTLARSAPGMAAPAPATLAKTGARPVAPAAPAPAAKGPTIEGSKAPAPVGVSTARPVPTAEAYPITTVGIPRGAPELVQPQIQTISLPPVAAAVTTAAAAVTATVAATSVAAKPEAPVVRPAAPSAAAGTSYPITTVGLPGYKPVTAVAAPTVTVAAAATPVRPADTARFEDALRGQAQPRPEPLRPELARPPSSQTPAPLAPVKPVASEPAATAPVTAAPVTAKPVDTKSADVPFVAVATSGAALAALAERAAAASATATPLKPVSPPVTVAPVSVEAAKVTPVTVAASSPITQAPASVTVAPVTVTPVVAPSASAGPADDLTRIRTIDTSMQSRLASAGVTRFADIAKWTPADVARISQATGTVGRIEQENWIEQAQILATGGDTEYSRRRLRGDVPAPVAAAPVAATAAPAAASANVTPISAVPSAAAAAAAAAMAAATAARASTSNSALGSPAAKLSDAIRDNADKAVEPMGRVLRPDLAGLRSVRSESLRGDGTAGDQPRGGGNRPMGVNEDLKRIRGIGVLIEKKLNSLGVNAYEQVANWTSADIDRISQILDFKGRIERENWVEQARILASGGQTEFSRRVDRGEA